MWSHTISFWIKSDTNKACLLSWMGSEMFCRCYFYGTLITFLTIDKVIIMNFKKSNLRLDLFCDRNCFRCNPYRIQSCRWESISFCIKYLQSKKWISWSKCNEAKNIFVLISFIYFICLENLQKDMILKYLDNKHNVKRFVGVWTWLVCDQIRCNPKGFSDDWIAYQPVSYLNDLYKIAAYFIYVWESQFV